MKNKIILNFIYIFFLCTFVFEKVYSEQFKFDVTEIEIINEGSIYKGLKRGVIETDDGIIIIADTF